MAQYQRPRGTRDFSPDEMETRRWAESIMRETIMSFGYREISTPTFEHTDLFVARSGPQVLEQIYSFKDKGGRDITLRPELTAPVMRFYNADMRNLPKPLRIFYFGNCFRYERPQKGRYREFWQMGLEYIGKRTPSANAEVISVAIKALEKVGLGDFTVRVGHVSLLSHLIKEFGGDPENDKDLMIAIDKKDKDAIRTILLSRGSTDPDPLIELVSVVYGHNEYLKALNEMRELADIEAINELEEVMDLLITSGMNVDLDPSISRGLDYYDGVVFEIDAPELGAEKQICGGGAYSLSSVFGSEVEGIGFGLGFDRIIVALGKDAKTITGKRPIFILPFGEETNKEAFSIATELRDEGYFCILETTGKNMKKAINSAVSRNCSHIIIIGENELSKGVVSVKDLDTKDQFEIFRKDVVKKLGIS